MKEGLKYFTDLEIPLLALCIFVIFFCCLLFWVYRKSAKPLYKHLAQQPLEDETYERR